MTLCFVWFCFGRAQFGETSDDAFRLQGIFSISRLCLQVRGAIQYPQKSPTYPQKSPTYPQKSPTGTWRYTIVQRALNAIKPYISAKEPYISAEGPYISAKEPYGYVALYNRSKSPEYPPHTQALYLRNKALHIRKRALLISFALLRICSPTYHKEPYICRALLRICKEPCKEPYISAKEPYISAIKPYISTKKPMYLQNTSTEER